jgi:hypothetical protein
MINKSFDTCSITYYKMQPGLSLGNHRFFRLTRDGVQVI